MLAQHLSVGTVLCGSVYRYTIKKVLGQGTFGITYLATTELEGPLGRLPVNVALKEFFVKDLNGRGEDGSVREISSESIACRYGRAFQRESLNLSHMKHPGIIRVLESFEANNTYYYAMEYVDGGSLDSYILSKGKLSEKEAVDCINAIGSALSYMHEQKMLHLDLKPKNIMLRTDGSPVLIDFGLSKQYDSTGEPESSSTIGLGTPGYAPLEQANSFSGRDFAATLDIYVLGGTFYKMLTGKSPVGASIILNDGFPEDELRNSGVSNKSIEAIRRAMSPQKKNRPQSVKEFLSLLGDDCSISSVVLEEDESTRMVAEPESLTSFAEFPDDITPKDMELDEAQDYVETALGISEGMVLQGSVYRYTIKKVLGKGDLGITYLATTEVKGPLGKFPMNVALKEFFVKGFNRRNEDGSVSIEFGNGPWNAIDFRRNSLKLSHMRYPGIIRVLEVFEANNTYYYATEYIDGTSLDSYILSKGRLSEKEAVECINAIGSSLSYMHEQKMLHFDLNPKNIMRRSDGSLVLVDFGLLLRHDFIEDCEAPLPSLWTPYVPLEQMQPGVSTFTPATDIYALGGTFYKMLTGKSPAEASIILMNDGISENELRNSGVSNKSIEAIRRAMSPQKKNRPQSVKEFLSLLGDDCSISSVLPEKDESTRMVAEAESLTSFVEFPDDITLRDMESNEAQDYVEMAFGINMKMVCVRGGSFTMGATSEQGGDFNDNEKPIHKVFLSDYYIGAFEVTQGQWEKVMGTSVAQQRDKENKDWSLSGVGFDYPMYYVSWEEAQSFCRELSHQTGKTYVLPTEAQWEYAARGGDKNEKTKYSGRNVIDIVAWHKGNSGESAHPVGMKRPNALGLYDMSGNVWEWCRDWYGDYEETSRTNPSRPISGWSGRVYSTDCVLRGGSWCSYARDCRVSSRSYDEPRFRHVFCGFRVVCIPSC